MHTFNIRVPHSQKSQFHTLVCACCIYSLQAAELIMVLLISFAGSGTQHLLSKLFNFWPSGFFTWHARQRDAVVAAQIICCASGTSRALTLAYFRAHDSRLGKLEPALKNAQSTAVWHKCVLSAADQPACCCMEGCAAVCTSCARLAQVLSRHETRQHDRPTSRVLQSRFVGMC
jgi:hypothetical protein